MATAAKFRIDVAIHDLLMNSSQRPPAPAQAQGLTLPEPVFPQFPERVDDPGPDDSAGEAEVGRKGCLPLLTRMARSLRPFASFARRVPPHHRVFVCRVQVQPRLLVLLVVQQQGQGHDRGRGPAFDRLAARQWLPGPGADGWRAFAAARIHS